MKRFFCFLLAVCLIMSGNPANAAEVPDGDARPALGMAVNFRKVSLDIGFKCGFSPHVMLYKGGNYYWHPIPAFGIGLWF